MEHKETAILFVYQGIPVHVGNDNMVDAKDMHRAANSPKNKEPWRFTETEQAKELISLERVTLGKSEVLRTTQGRFGSTWMSRKLATAYAAYLDTRFYSFVLDVFLAWGDGKLVPAPSSDLSPIDTGALVREIADARQEIASLREASLKEIALVRQEVAQEMAELRHEIAIFRFRKDLAA